MNLLRNLVAPAALLLPLACGGSDESAPLPTPPTDVGCEGCIVLSGGIVFDGTVAGPGTVVLDGDRVAAVVRGEVRVVAGEVVDVTGATVMPGMIDMHVHTPATAGPRGWFLERSLFDDHLKAMLRAGVTAYADLLSSRRLVYEHRARVDAGKKLGPKIFAAGGGITPSGGHPCLEGSPPGDACWLLDDASQVPEAMEEMLGESPDLIKVLIESGAISPLPQLSFEVMVAVQEEAQAAGKRVIAHVSEAEDVELALDAGITAFAHMAALDALPPALVDRLVEEHAVIVPTLAVFDGYWELAHAMTGELDDPALLDDVAPEVIAALKNPTLTNGFQSAAFRELTETWTEFGSANVKACFDAGVTIAAGTDAGNAMTFHGLAMARELELYVQAGLPPIDALTAGTKNGADLLGDAERGRLEPGALADVLVVDGDATTDITALRHVRGVYLHGALIDRAALALPAGTSLDLDAPHDSGEGTTCLGAGECATGFYCGWQNVCAAECGAVSCPSGAACFPQSSGPNGFCYQGDGCDPLAQDCPNETGCIWLGNGATLCWATSDAVQGEPCVSQTCAKGYACDLFSNSCTKLCDPMAAMSDCPMGLSCVDRTAAAGLPVGECG
jgi:imidazolonepropionase-like amidohydrolase